MSVATAPTVSVQLSSVKTWTGMLRLKSVWNHLAAGDDDGVLLGHDWFAQCWKSFPESRRAEILTFCRADAVKGILPLCRPARQIVRYLEFLDDQHSQRLDLIAEPVEIEPMLWALGEHLRRRRDWDVLELARLRAATAERVLRIWPEAGLQVRIRGGVRQRYLPLNGSWETVSASFQSVLLKNLRRREKRLKQRAPYDVRRHTSGRGLRLLLDQCFQVEASGWKGREGTAIRCQAPVERFYRQLAFRLARQNCLRIYSLWQQDQLLAFQFCAAHRRRLASLKVGYLDSFREYSPGQILQKEVLRMAWEEGMTRFDFLGEDQPHQADWTPLTEALVHLRIYNHTLRGRAMAQRAELWRWWQSRQVASPISGSPAPTDPL